MAGEEGEGRDNKETGSYKTWFKNNKNNLYETIGEIWIFILRGILLNF